MEPPLRLSGLDDRYLDTFPCQSLDFVLEDTFCQGAYILLLLEPTNILVEN